jgi:hypothetical protein
LLLERLLLLLLLLLFRLRLLLLLPAPALAPCAARAAETVVEASLSCCVVVPIRGAVTSLPAMCIGTGLVHSVMLPFPRGWGCPVLFLLWDRGGEGGEGMSGLGRVDMSLTSKMAGA